MLRRMRYWLFLGALLAFTAAGAKDEFLPIEQAFTYLAQSDGRSLTVQWNVAPGYYLYKSRMALESGTEDLTLGEAKYPKGEIHEDEYLGPQEILRDDFTVTAPLKRSRAPTQTQAGTLKLELKLQGCADAGLCYPPTVWTAEVPLPGKAP